MAYWYKVDINWVKGQGQIYDLLNICFDCRSWNIKRIDFKFAIWIKQMNTEIMHQSQGHQITGNVKCVCPWSTDVFGYNSCTIGWIRIENSERVHINDCYSLVQGRGLWVYGQGQIRDFLKNRLWCVSQN